MVDRKAAANLLYLPLDKLMQQARRPAPRRAAPAAPRARAAATPAGSVDVRSRDGRAQPRPRIARPGERDDEPHWPRHRRLSLLALMLLSSTLFIVDQRQYAIVFALGEIKEVISEPGLNFKLPPPFQNVRLPRQAHPDARHPEPTASSPPRRRASLVDCVRQVAHHRRRASTTSATAATRCRARDAPDARSCTAALQRRVHQAHRARRVSGERDKIMERRARQGSTDDAKRIGVEIVDVRLKRVDLSPDITESVYRRMESERKRVANELRSTGAAEAREDPRRRRPAARGDPRRGLSRRAEDQGRGRREGVRDLRRGVRRRTASSTRSTAASRRTARASAARAT